MAKRVKRPAHPNRRTVSRLQREAMLQRWLRIGMIALFGVIAVLIGWGVYTEYVVKPRRVLANVHGDSIRMDEYEQAVSFREYTTNAYLSNLVDQRAGYASMDGQESMVQILDQQIQSAEMELQALPETVLQEMVEDRIIRREAAQRGITVTEEEVQLELERQFQYDRNPPTPEPVSIEATEGLTQTGAITDTEGITETAAPTPTAMTHEQFVEYSTSYFQALRQAIGFTEEDFRQVLEADLYRSKVEEALMAEMPTSTEQVHALHILVETEEEAQQVLARLEAGEAFEDLASELSLDTTSGQAGGDLGWFARGHMVEVFEEAAFALQPGETSEPVASQFGYHVIRVVDREEDRPLEEADLQQYQRALLEAWYQEQLDAEGVEIYWDQSLAPS
jgi:parvulin-like peptidyl-prolyl isomerase